MIVNLQGARILVTRPLLQAENLCALIEQQGGKAIRFPTLEIVEAQPEPQVLQLALRCDWLIFTSSNAVDFALKAFNGKMPATNLPRIAAVGQATARGLEKAGWRVDCLPTEYSSEGLLATAPFQKVADLRCVIVRGVGGREKLAEELTARGAKVQYLEVYKRLQATTNRAVLVDCLANQQLQLVTVTSVESLQNLCAMLDTCSRALLSELPLVVVSERIKQVAEQMGFKQVAVCKQATDAAILETLTTLLNGENSGRIIRKTTR